MFELIKILLCKENTQKEKLHGNEKLFNVDSLMFVCKILKIYF